MTTKSFEKFKKGHKNLQLGIKNLKKIFEIMKKSPVNPGVDKVKVMKKTIYALNKLTDIAIQKYKLAMANKKCTPEIRELCKTGIMKAKEEKEIFTKERKRLNKKSKSTKKSGQ